MKSILLSSTLVFTLFAQAPSQNSALKSISPSGSQKNTPSAIQNSLDSWLRDDWEPAQKKNQEKEKSLHVKEKEKNSSSFKLQSYVNKWEKYNKEKASEPKKPSHVEMINSLPAIGK